MGNEVKNLKKVPKHKLRAERRALEEEQKELRVVIKDLDKAVDEAKDDEIKALKENDGDAIAAIEARIDNLENKISKLEKRYKTNAEALEIYSKILKNNREGAAASTTSIAGCITGLGGLLLGAIGMAAAYDGDREGKLIHKGTLAEAKDAVRKFVKW